MLGLLALNKLTATDKVFFIVLAAIIAVAIAIYFLIPLFNKKQYKEQRDNLKKREVAFKSNIRRTDGSVVIDENPAETPADVSANIQTDEESVNDR